MTIEIRPQEAALLTRVAFEKLMLTMRTYGNVLSDKHREALFKIIRTYTDLATGRQSGRWAFPLQTGGGKTQSIVAWLYAVEYLSRSQIPALAETSVAIAQSRVECLCQLKRDLIAAGVPEDEIGLIHAYRHDPDAAEAYLKNGELLPEGYASEESTAPDYLKNCRFLLVTHNRIKNRTCEKHFNHYRGQERSLLIWDESLLTSECRALSLQKLMIGKAALEAYAFKMNKASWHTAKDYVCNAVDTFVDEMAKNSKSTRTIRLPRLTSGQEWSYKNAMGCHPNNAEVKALMEVCQQDLRVVDTGPGGQAVITYETKVPKSLKNIVVLDASYNVRDLCQEDKTVKQDPTFPKALVSYHNVEVKQLLHGGGRSAITEAFQARGGRPLVKEIVEYIKAIPEDEGVLMFTFLPKDITGIDGRRMRKLNFKDQLEAALDDAGVDTSAQIVVDGVLRDRFNWMTHGSTASVSKYSFCKHQVWVGALYRALGDIASNMAGQRDDIATPLPQPEIRQASLGEVCYELHQGFGRGASRVVKDGVAGAQTIFLVLSHNDAEAGIKDRLLDAMPGMVWTEYKAKYVTPAKPKQKRLAEQLVGYLESLEGGIPNGHKVSTTKLKKTLDLNDVPSRTFTHAVRVADRMMFNWNLTGRSFQYSA